MIKITDKRYITIKEASKRYGMSESWFKDHIRKNKGPISFQIDGKGIRYFDIDQTDDWFKNNMKFKDEL